MARFTETKKKDAVEAIRSEGLSLPVASRRFGVSTATLTKWLRENDGLDEISEPHGTPLQEEVGTLQDLGSPATIPLPPQRSRFRGIEPETSAPPVLSEFDAVSSIYRTLESLAPSSRKRVQKGVAALLEALDGAEDETPAAELRNVG